MTTIPTVNTPICLLNFIVEKCSNLTSVHCCRLLREYFHFLLIYPGMRYEHALNLLLNRIEYLSSLHMISPVHCVQMLYMFVKMSLRPMNILNHIAYYLIDNFQYLSFSNLIYTLSCFSKLQCYDILLFTGGIEHILIRYQTNVPATLKTYVHATVALAYMIEHSIELSQTIHSNLFEFLSFISKRLLVNKIHTHIHIENKQCICFVWFSLD
jgi:hypothetical protein